MLYLLHSSMFISNSDSFNTLQDGACDHVAKSADLDAMTNKLSRGCALDATYVLVGDYLQLKRVRQTTTRIPRDDVDGRAFELCAYASIMILVWLIPSNLKHSSDFTMHRSSRTRRTDSRPPCPADDVRRSDILFVNNTEIAWQAQQAPLWMAKHPFLSCRRQRTWVSTAPNTAHHKRTSTW